MNNILITGACGVTSRTLARSLRKSEHFKNCNLIGTDVCENLYGIFEGMFDKIYKVPWQSDSEKYKKIIFNVCEKERIDLAIIATELEVLFWSSRKFPVPTLLPPSKFCNEVISKYSLYETLKDTKFIPNYEVSDSRGFSEKLSNSSLTFPMWMRGHDAGSSSGKGAIKVNNFVEIESWFKLNPSIKSFMFSEYLPGRNIACLLLYEDGVLIKKGCYERLEYFMAKTTISGITGNINKGKLINDDNAVRISNEAIKYICNKTNEVMSGLVTVDLCGDLNGDYKITEINIRPVAATSAFSEIDGANFSEAQLLALQDKKDLIVEDVVYPKNNLILRDIDGLPILLKNFEDIKEGDYFSNSSFKIES